MTLFYFCRALPDGVVVGPDDLLGTTVDVKGLESVVQPSGPDVNGILEGAVQDRRGVRVATPQSVVQDVVEADGTVPGRGQQKL